MFQLNHHVPQLISFLRKSHQILIAGAYGSPVIRNLFVIIGLSLGMLMDCTDGDMFIFPNM